MDALIFYGFPVYAVLIASEMLYLSSRDSEHKYRLNNALSNASSGFLDRVVNALSAVLFLSFFGYIEQKYGLFNISATSIFAGILAFIGIDFLYYWFHRASHRINILWSAHIGHHQSESYDLTVSLRHSVFAGWINKAFYLPLAFLGFPAILFVLANAVFQAYQFFVHTSVVKSFGKLDWLIASPLLHQVHHARNARYLDRNYGGVFIIWDRLFHTFANYSTAAKDKILFGITTGIRKWNPIWANFHYLAFLARNAKKLSTWKEKIMVWIKPPDWEGLQLAREEEKTTIIHGYDSVLSRPVQIYVAVQFLLNVYALYIMLSFRPSISSGHFWTVLAFLGVNFIVLPMLFDKNSFALRFERIRHFFGMLVAVYCLLSFSELMPFSWFLLFIEMGALVWYLLMNTREFRGRVQA